MEMDLPQEINPNPPTDLTRFVAEGHRGWTWTLGSKEKSIHEEDDHKYMEALKAFGIKRCVIGIETGKTGYKHWQCAAEFDKPYTFADVKSYVGWLDYVPGKLKYHDPTTKKFYNAWHYCTKTGRVNMYGHGKTERKSAGDTAIEVNNMIRAGMSLKEIDDVYPVYVMYHLDKLEKYAAWREGKYKRGRYDPEPDDRY